MPKRLRNLVVNEISSVDRGAADGARVMLFKRGTDMSGEMYDLSKLDGLSAETVAYLKRSFSADERRRAAASGAAMSDGSYPIENESDLHNAIRAVGRGSNNSHAAIRRHIMSRARTLGLTSALPGDWKSGGTRKAFGKLSSWLGMTEPTLPGQIIGTVEALHKTVAAIVADSALDATAKAAAVRKAFDDAADHLDGSIPASIAEALAEAGIDISKEGQMADETEAERKAREEREEKASKERDEKARKEREEKEDRETREKLLKALGAGHASAVEKMVPRHARFAEKLDGGERRAFMLMSDGQRQDHMQDHPLAGMGDGSAGNTDGTPDRETRKRLDELETFRKRAEASETALGELLAERETADLRKRAADAGLPDAEADTIRKALRGDKEAVFKLLATIKTLHGQVEEAGLFREHGSRNPLGGASAYDQMMGKAAELRKADPKLTIEQAFAKVYADPANRETVKLYKRETRAAA